MKPVVFSQIESDENGSSWKREGFQISYVRNNILREGSSNKYYYSLSFSIQFQHQNDIVYIAQCFPYTYTDLSKFVTKLFNDPERKCFISKKLLCYSIAKNKCEIFTITSSGYFTEQDEQNGNENQNSQPDVLSPLKRPHQLKDKKKIVFLTARQHPGETPASYIIQGVMEFLTNPKNEEAAFLREHFIFKVVPMMNPDGVIHGNYRCSLSGVDLNRQWLNPSKELNPTVYFAKNAILKYCQERKCRLLCDFHGHSKKMNSFFYGNPYESDIYLPKIIPFECQNINKAIEFKSCTFKLSQDKESTFRQALLDEMPYNPYIYTFEASFFGTKIQGVQNHFSVEDFKNLGRDIILGFYRSTKQEVEEEIIQFSLKEQRVKSLVSITECDMKDEVFNKNPQQTYKNLVQNLIDAQEILNEVDNGSDSNPSEDELSKKERNSLNQQNTKKITKKLSIQQSLLRNEIQKQSSKESIKKQIKNLIEERNPSITHSTIENIQTRVSSQIRIEQLFHDKQVQTESNFDFSKLQKFSNQNQFFQQLQDPNLFTEYTEEKEQIHDFPENSNQTEQQLQNQFKNKYIMQALQHNGQNINNSSSTDSVYRPNTTLVSDSVYSQRRNNSVGLRKNNTIHESEIKNNILNNTENAYDSQIFYKRGTSLHSASVSLQINAYKTQINMNPFIISSYTVSQQQNQLLASLQNANRICRNNMTVSGLKYQNDNKIQKLSQNDHSFNNSMIINNKKSKVNKEIQTEISIPILLSQNSTAYKTSNLNEIYRSQQYPVKSNQQNQMQQSQMYMSTYNKNHLNKFSPKKKQYLLCIQKKDPNSQFKGPIRKKVLNNPVQQNNLIKNINQKVGQQINQSQIIKLFQNTNNTIQHTQQYPQQVDDSLNKTMNFSKIDRNISFDINKYNCMLTTITSSSIEKDYRSNSANVSLNPSNQKKQNQVKQNVMSQNNILFTEQGSQDYMNAMQTNQQIRQTSPFQSPLKKSRNIRTAPSIKPQRNIKSLSTEPSQQH